MLLAEHFQMPQVTPESPLTLGWWFGEEQDTNPWCEGSQSHCRAGCCWRGASVSPCRRTEIAWSNLQPWPGRSHNNHMETSPWHHSQAKSSREFILALVWHCVFVTLSQISCRRVPAALGTNSFGLGGHPWSGNREFCSCHLCRES